MLIFIATFLGLFSLYMLLQTLRPLIERTVITSDDWQRIDDQSSALIGRRDRILDELRDLEFEASLNKIVGRDLEELRHRYEGEALAVMARLEAEAKTFEGRIGRDIDSVIATAQARRDSNRTATAPTPGADNVKSSATVEAVSNDGPKTADASANINSKPSPAGTIICTLCNSTNRPQARFCDACGAPLEVAQ